jgi:hypothetical protein
MPLDPENSTFNFDNWQLAYHDCGSVSVVSFLAEDGEERKGKRHKYRGQRGISPIEWDRKTASDQEKSDSGESSGKEELAGKYH